MNSITRGVLALVLGVPALAAAQLNVGPDAAVGSVEERLASGIEFDCTGVFMPGQGFTAHVRLTWSGTAAVKSRSVYGDTAESDLREAAFRDAGRSGFYNFTIVSARVIGGGSEDLPSAIEYDVREAMSFGKAGRFWRFYVPMPRLMRRLEPTRVAQTPERRKSLLPDPSRHDRLAEQMRQLIDAEPPVGVLPVGDVGRWTLRARYTLADGMYATAPPGRHVETDFATYDSTYAVEGRDVVARRSIVLKRLTLAPEREADLQSFFLAVDADRRSTFTMTSFPSGARTDADRLNEQAVDALEGRDLPRAGRLLQQAIDADPRHRWAWYNLAAVRLAGQDFANATQAAERALDVDPENPYARLLLAEVYQRSERPADAERLLKEQVEKYPWSAWSLQTLARMYQARHMAAEALPLWLRAVEAGPRDESAVLALGLTYLDLNKSPEAVDAWTDGLKLSRNGLPYNEAAWALADRGVELDAAERLIGQGLDVFVRSVLQPAPEDPPSSRREITGYLGAMWDTAGWVAYKRGDSDTALAWLRAAWQLSEASDIAEHFGDVLAGAKRTDDAATAYAGALGREPGRSSARQKLAALAPDRAVNASDAERASIAARTIVLTGGPISEWKGDLDVAHDRAGRVVDVTARGEAPTAVLDAVRAARVPFRAPPDNRPYRLERRVSVTCPGNAPCTAVLWRPSDVPLR
jgi:tetratricopeptide (TPR) repeat protein